MLSRSYDSVQYPGKLRQALAIADSESVFRSMGLEQQSTNAAEQTELINELAQEWLSKPRELWRQHE